MRRTLPGGHLTDKDENARVPSVLIRTLPADGSSPCHRDETLVPYPHPVVCCPDCGELYPAAPASKTEANA